MGHVLESTDKIKSRFCSIKSVDDFINSDDGQVKLDSICMQLIAIGESLKNIDKITERELFSKYPQMDWKKAKGLRDIITHHYFDLDFEIVFSVCENQIPKMGIILKKIITEL